MDHNTKIIQALQHFGTLLLSGVNDDEALAVDILTQLNLLMVSEPNLLRFLTNPETVSRFKAIKFSDKMDFAGIMALIKPVKEIVDLYQKKKINA